MTFSHSQAQQGDYKATALAKGGLSVILNPRKLQACPARHHAQTCIPIDNKMILLALCVLAYENDVMTSERFCSCGNCKDPSGSFGIVRVANLFFPLGGLSQSGWL